MSEGAGGLTLLCSPRTWATGEQKGWVRGSVSDNRQPSAYSACHPMCVLPSSAHSQGLKLRIIKLLLNCFTLWKALDGWKEKS